MIAKSEDKRLFNHSQSVCCHGLFDYFNYI